MSENINNHEATVAVRAKSDESFSDTRVIGSSNEDTVATELSNEIDNTNIYNNFVKSRQKESGIEAKATKKHKKKVRRPNYSAYGGIVLATLVVCISIVISLFVIVVGRDVLGIESDKNVFSIYIEEGSSTKDIAKQLYDEGIVQYQEVFIALAQFKDADGNMCPGDIEVSRSMSYSDLIDALVEIRERKETATVTFQEGITLIEAANKLEDAGVCSAEDFIYTFNNTLYGYEFEQYVKANELKLYKYEGFLMPNTYEFYLNDTPYNVAKKIKNETAKVLDANAIKRASELGMDIEQVVILASIVEKEAGFPEDMKKIASVFINRLNHPEIYPKLQSDTTYSYVDLIKEILTIEYPEMYEAYDTYTCYGLPVGAICNPSSAAIDAVLYPEETDYFYFCSNLETRETFFAETYEQHLQNCIAAGLR